MNLLTPAENAERTQQTPASDFIRRWVEYGASRTHAPREFHMNVAFILISADIDRNRWLPFKHKNVYPSLYALNLGPSGIVKSVPLDYGQALLLNGLKGKLLANDYSAEALIEDLAARNPSHGVAMVDEAGRLLQTMQKNGYAEGLKDTLSKLWDCPPVFERKLMKGTYNLAEVYVSLVLAVTISRFLNTTSPEDIASGFLARFLPMMVTETPPHKPLALLEVEAQAALTALTEDLTQIHATLAKAPGPLAITPEALARLNQGEEAVLSWAGKEFESEHIGPWALRLCEYLSRLAIIFSVSEHAETVTRQHVLRALYVVDTAKENVRALVEEMVKGHQARDLDKAFKFIVANPGLSSSMLLRGTHWTADKLKTVTETLRDQERILIKASPSKKGLQFFPIFTSSPITKSTKLDSPTSATPAEGACDYATGEDSPIGGGA